MYAQNIFEKIIQKLYLLFWEMVCIHKCLSICSTSNIINDKKYTFEIPLLNHTV